MEFNSHKSIFLQIADNITEKILDGTFPAGEKIPSVREEAASVGVNPNTIMRTYNELQSMEIIENKRGIGYFVHPDAKKTIMKNKKEEFFSVVLPEIVRQAGLIGISVAELKSQVDKLSK